MTKNPAEEYAALQARLREAIGKVIVGQREVVDSVLSCLFCGGHCLLEGAPGLGKTLLVRTLAQALGLQFSRLQFTPDLMPADITGANVLEETGKGGYALSFRPGPVFAQIVLADEINRATPKTQSALLEAMQEGTVTAGGATRPLPAPFFVLATQNPIEMEGTYPLPEAQLDRFLQKVLVPAPARDDLRAILERATSAAALEKTASPVADGANGDMALPGAGEILRWRQIVREVIVPPEVSDYAARLVLATSPSAPEACALARQYVRYGSSPRGGVALLLAAKERALAAGRYNACFADVRNAVSSCLRHRVILNFSGEAEGMSVDKLLHQAVEVTPEML